MENDGSEKPPNQEDKSLASEGGGDAKQQIVGVEIPRAGKRNRRDWNRYCASLAHAFRQRAGGGEEGGAEGARSGPPPERRPKPTPAPDGVTRQNEQRCSFYMKQKTRTCSRPRVPSTEFCVAHQHEGAAAGGGAQPSPVEGGGGEPGKWAFCESCKTRVQAAKLRKHVARCNVVRERREVQSQAFYSEGLNSGGDGAMAAAVGAVLGGAGRSEMGEEEEETAASFAARVERAYQCHVGGSLREVEAEMAEAAAAAGLSWRGEGGGDEVTVGRHLVQHAAIVGALKEKGLILPPGGGGGTAGGAVLLELGAAKGMLSLAICEEAPEARVLFVERERGPNRTRADKVLRQRPGGAPSVGRVQMDIRHLDLARVPFLREIPAPTGAAAVGGAGGGGGAAQGAELPPVLAVAKHLCGVATDLGLKCLASYVRGGRAAPAANVSATEGGCVRGVAIAVCCHGQCAWDDYVGRAHWEAMGLSARDFERARAVSGWCTGCRPAAEAEAAKAAATGGVPEAGGGAGGGVASARSRMRQGRQCKRLMDAGRAAYVREALGLECELVSYCPESTSAENCLLLAWLPG